MGLEANKLTSSLLAKSPPLKPLVIALKYFLNRRGLLEAFTGGMSSYALLLLTARYLQEVRGRGRGRGRGWTGADKSPNQRHGRL